jgi:hypothetical protein
MTKHIPRAPTNRTSYKLAAGYCDDRGRQSKSSHCKSASRRVSAHDTAPRRASTLRAACPGSNARRLVPGSAEPGHLQMHVLCLPCEGHREAAGLEWPARLVGLGHAHVDVPLHDYLCGRIDHGCKSKIVEKQTVGGGFRPAPGCPSPASRCSCDTNECRGP